LAGVASQEFAVTACVLLHRDGSWLLSVRSPSAAYAPGRLGLIGGHVEVEAPAPDVLEATARRELAEETGLDLTTVPLTYLESEFFITDGGERQVTVTFVAAAPAGVAASIAAPDELSEVGWWTREQAAADPRCPDWLPGLLRRAGGRLRSSSIGEAPRWRAEER
jgi:8-oxo-dGTP pyrophosphatase MutT (NUDIX family)